MCVCVLLFGEHIQNSTKYISISTSVYVLLYPSSRMDPSRVAAVGPDRAAAEWILRLGGRVQFKEFDDWSSDYNRLPSGSKGSLKLVAIDGSGLGITSNGLEHLSE